METLASVSCFLAGLPQGWVADAEREQLKLSFCQKERGKEPRETLPDIKQITKSDRVESQKGYPNTVYETPHKSPQKAGL